MSDTKMVGKLVDSRNTTLKDAGNLREAVPTEDTPKIPVAAFNASL
jgi:hypothetical protein